MVPNGITLVLVHFRYTFKLEAVPPRGGYVCRPVFFLFSIVFFILLYFNCLPTVYQPSYSFPSSFLRQPFQKHSEIAPNGGPVSMSQFPIPPQSRPFFWIPSLDTLCVAWDRVVLCSCALLTNLNHYHCRSITLHTILTDCDQHLGLPKLLDTRFRPKARI